MRAREPCSHDNCGNAAVTGASECADHLPRRYPQQLASLIAETHELLWSSFERVSLSGLSFAGLALYGVTFREARLEECDFSDSVLSYCFFDSATLRSCSFARIHVRSCSFGAAELIDTNFSEGNVIQTSFNGALLQSGGIEMCDLLHTRFLSARLNETRVEDCNLKACDFSRSTRTAVSFRYSNVEDATGLDTDPPTFTTRE